MLYQLPGERQCRSTGLLHRLTADFVHAVPDDKWNFTPPTHRETRAGYRRLSTLAMASRHFASKYGI
jgi:hypothetical protein